VRCVSNVILESYRLVKNGKGNKLIATKIIKDAVHGFIEFEGESENRIRQLLSDPFFQRLRRVKQLGFSDYVFPSASHSRFAHSLGVFSVAKRMLSIVEPHVKGGEWSDEGNACLAAALLHDIGHGMFSHSFEKAMDFYFTRNPSQKELKPQLNDAVDHEKMTQKIILHSSISESLSRVGGRDFPKLVAAMLDKSREGCIYSAIVSSQLDADRLDYVKRDPYFAGVSSGGVDLDWLLRNLKLGKNDGGSYFYVNSKAYISLEQFAVTLFQLYPTIYFHKKTRGLEFMFSLLMSKVFEKIASGQEGQVGLPKNHPFLSFFEHPENLENSVLLDDSLFWGAIYQFSASSDFSIQRIAQRIARREIFPVLDVWKKVEKHSAVIPKLKEMSAAARFKFIDSVCADVCNEISSRPEFIGDGCYYDTYGRPIYKRKDIDGGNSGQINVEVGGEVVDIASISPLVASAAAFNIHRIYYDDNDGSLEERLERDVQDLILKSIREH